MRRVSPLLTDALLNLMACSNRRRLPRPMTSLSHISTEVLMPCQPASASGGSRPLTLPAAPRRRGRALPPRAAATASFGCRDVLSPRARGHRSGFLPRLGLPRPLDALRRGLRSLSCGTPCLARSPRRAPLLLMTSPAALLFPAEAGPSPLAGTAARHEGFGARRLPPRSLVTAVTLPPGRPPRGRLGPSACSCC
jgi:hypothetical protein